MNEESVYILKNYGKATINLKNLLEEKIWVEINYVV